MLLRPGIYPDTGMLKQNSRFFKTLLVVVPVVVVGVVEVVVEIIVVDSVVMVEDGSTVEVEKSKSEHV